MYIYVPVKTEDSLRIPLCQCSTTCGSGIQRRELKCSTKDRNGRYHPVPSRKCRHARRPRISLTSSCSNNLCTGLTTTVSHVTTTASQRRKVGRPARVNTLPGSSQDTIHKSSHTGQWISGSWQQVRVLFRTFSQLPIFFHPKSDSFHPSANHSSL